MNATTPACCPECRDSPLTWTGNVLGILTFVLGLTISSAAFVAATRGADKEIQYSKGILRETEEQINKIQAQLDTLKYRGGNNLQHMDQLIYDSLESLKNAREAMDRKLTNFKTPTSLWNRVLWWYDQKEIGVGMAKLDCQGQLFSTVQLTLLL
ncbi:hypothetical protein BDZ45DRAFT_675605, partial [Acephala macrosclerotiorum]